MCFDRGVTNGKYRHVVIRRDRPDSPEAPLRGKFGYKALRARIITIALSMPREPIDNR